MTSTAQYFNILVSLVPEIGVGSVMNVEILIVG